MGEFLNETVDMILEHEGGYVNDPADPGGETYKGISRRHWGNWAGWEKIDAAKGQLNFHELLEADETLQADIRKFYLDNFLNPMGWDVMPKYMALMAVDMGVNTGLKRTLSALQKMLGLEVDGVLGKNTRAAFAIIKPGDLDRLTTIRLLYYFTISVHNPPLAKFLPGWTRRTIKVYKKALSYVVSEVTPNV